MMYEYKPLNYLGYCVSCWKTLCLHLWNAWFLTHGHEHAIGAVTYVLEQVDAPVYGSKLTIGLVKENMKARNVNKTVRRVEKRYVYTFETHDRFIVYSVISNFLVDISCLHILFD